MFCSKCGTKLNEGVQFCHSCGSKVSNNLNENPKSLTKSIPKKKFIGIISGVVVLIIGIVIFNFHGNNTSAAEAVVRNYYNDPNQKFNYDHPDDWVKAGDQYLSTKQADETKSARQQVVDQLVKSKSNISTKLIDVSLVSKDGDTFTFKVQLDATSVFNGQDHVTRNDAEVVVNKIDSKYLITKFIPISHDSMK